MTATAVPPFDLASDQGHVDAHVPSVAGSLASDQLARDIHDETVAGLRNADHMTTDAQRRTVGVPEDLLLAVQTYKATQQLRMATANRVRAVTQAAEAEDAQPPDLRLYEAQLKALESVEGKVGRHVKKLMRSHPLFPWVQQHHGIGELSVAHFLGAVYSISYNTLAERPRRRPAELWAYCGLAPGQKRRKGVRSNWSTEAKIGALLMAEGCIKAGPRSPYEPVYRDYRARYADRVHAEPCAQCGSKGHPAQPGSAWRPGHQQAAAVRATAKRILRDLFVEARRLGV